MQSARLLLAIILLVSTGAPLRAEEQEKSAPDPKRPIGDSDAIRPAKAVRLTANEPVTGVRVFDETASVELAPNVRFIKGADGKLIFKRLPKAPRSQIFEGFSPGDVVFEAGSFEPNDQVPPEWWGASANDDPASAAQNVSAINAALAAVAKSPLAVSLSGIYYINDKVRPLSHSRLTAAGQGGIKAVPKISFPLYNYLVEIHGQTEVTIDGIEVDGNRGNQIQDATHTYGGIIAFRSDHCTIKNCKVHDCNGPPTGGAIGNGIRTHIATDITIADNEIYSNNGCGINIYNTSRRIQIVNNTIGNNCEIGIESEGRGKNYKDFRNKAITITGNRITGSTEPGRVTDHSILVDWTDDSTLTNNQCHGSTHNGIEILGSHNIEITGNDCEKNGDRGPPYLWAGIRLTAEGFREDGRSSHVVIRNNRVAGSQYGIYLDTADHVVIKANKIEKAIHGSLMVGGLTTEIDISDNALEARP